MIRSILCMVLLAGITASSVAQQKTEQADTAYQLPEVLKTQSGKTVRTVAEWENVRRPEILSLFAENVYGKTPSKKLPLRFVTTSVNTQALNGKATRKEITVYFSEDDKYNMNILIYLPNQVNKPAPLFLGLNFSGNQVVNTDTGITISKKWMAYGKEPAYKDHHATEASRGTQAGDWPVEDIISRGYGLATIYYGDLQPDSSDSFNAGAGVLFYKEGQKPAPDEWGAIGVWAWGLSRAMDYIETDKDIDKKRIAVIGHSRLGKTALWAGAQDKRFALVVSNNSGEGGAAITRRKYGETIEVINRVFPHWFCGNYKAFAKREDELPVDYHELIALIAPRPVYVASASEDQWADPVGEYLSAYYAGPVYALYKLQGLTNLQPPGESEPVGNGVIGYHMRKGVHALMPYDWQQYMNFADRFFKPGK